MSENKKKIKPFKTAAGAVQFMRNFDPDNMVESSYEEMDKMIAIFEKENEKLGPKKFKEKYAGKTLSQVKQRLEAMRRAQMAEGYRQRDGNNSDIVEMYDDFEKGRLDLEKKLGKNRGGLMKTGHKDYRKTGLFT